MGVKSKYELLKFRRNCKLKSIKFYVANDLHLALYLNSDGLYLSSSNKSLKFLSVRKKLEIIGSAHNIKEVVLKKSKVVNLFYFPNYFW